MVRFLFIISFQNNSCVLIFVCDWRSSAHDFHYFPKLTTVDESIHETMYNFTPKTRLAINEKIIIFGRH